MSHWDTSHFFTCFPNYYLFYFFRGTCWKICAARIMEGIKSWQAPSKQTALYYSLQLFQREQSLVTSQEQGEEWRPLMVSPCPTWFNWQISPYLYKNLSIKQSRGRRSWLKAGPRHFQLIIKLCFGRQDQNNVTSESALKKGKPDLLGSTESCILRVKTTELLSFLSSGCRQLM